jgi:hypothetical protein
MASGYCKERNHQWGASGGSGAWGHRPPERRASGEFISCRTLRRIRSSVIVRAAELVRRLDADTDPVRARMTNASPL